jgi:hypothetical protein
LWEINEAFAAQVLACVAAWESDDYCRERLGLPGALGKLDAGSAQRRRWRRWRSAIRSGHRAHVLSCTLLHVLARTAKAKRGIASICIGGGLRVARCSSRRSPDSQGHTEDMNVMDIKGNAYTTYASTGGSTSTPKG